MAFLCCYYLLFFSFSYSWHLNTNKENFIEFKLFLNCISFKLRLDSISMMQLNNDNVLYLNHYAELDPVFNEALACSCSSIGNLRFELWQTTILHHLLYHCYGISLFLLECLQSVIRDIWNVYCMLYCFNVNLKVVVDAKKFP